MDRPGNRPGEPRRTRFFAERAEGIVAPGDADVRLDPASIEPLFELRPFVSRERSALEANDARRRRVRATVRREDGSETPHRPTTPHKRAKAAHETHKPS